MGHRFLIIQENQKTIFWVALVSGILCFTFWIIMPFTSRILSILPLCLSLLYVVPVFTNNRRLRDFPLIKIFLIAFCWSLFSVTIPMIEAGYPSHETLLLSLERLCFFYAITIPFDIRDYIIDMNNNVSTLPGLIGLQAAKYSAYIAMIIGPAILIKFGVALIPVILLGLTVLLLIYCSDLSRRDLYYTGLMDGTMILYFVILYFL